MAVVTPPERAEQFPELRPRLDAQLGQVAALERELHRFPFLGQGEQRLEAREVARPRCREQCAVDVKLAVEAMQRAALRLRTGGKVQGRLRRQIDQPRALRAGQFEPRGDQIGVAFDQRGEAAQRIGLCLLYTSRCV